MAIEIKVPVLPESVSDATVSTWHKKPGEAVKRDEHLVDIETDKVVLEVVAPQDGVLEKVLKPTGSTVLSQEVIGVLGASSGAVASAPTPEKTVVSNEQASSTPAEMSPSVRRMVSEKGVDPSAIVGTGKSGRVTKSDVERSAPQPASIVNVPQGQAVKAAPVQMSPRGEERVPMTRLRSKIAERLVNAQHTAAILTTFNEINMAKVMALRSQYKDQFEKRHGVRLGFMSFFVKAAVEALRRFPAVNASIDGNDIVYHGYFDIGVAVSSPRGLVVPVLRDADKLTMAEIEEQITLFGQKAKDGTLSLEDMTGGTFTISNGGVFGSLMSTPILNPPQTGILGLHKIEDRAVVEDGQIVVRPMMYVALSYDHRLVDGSESVRFLVTIKEMIEDPTRLLLEI